MIDCGAAGACSHAWQPRPNAGLVMQGCNGCGCARRWLRLCKVMAVVVLGDGCWLLAVGCWLVLCQAMAQAVLGDGCGCAR